MSIIYIPEISPRKIEVSDEMPEDAEVHFLTGWDDKFHTYVPTFKGRTHSEEWCSNQSKRVSGMNNPMSGPNRLKRKLAKKCK